MFGLFKKRIPLAEAAEHTSDFLRQSANGALQKFLDHYGRDKISSPDVFELRKDNYLAAWSYVVFLFGLKADDRQIQQLSYLALSRNIPMREKIVALRNAPDTLNLQNLDELTFLILDQSFNSNGIERRQIFTLDRISDMSMIPYINMRADFRSCINYLHFISTNFRLT